MQERVVVLTNLCLAAPQQRQRALQRASHLSVRARRAIAEPESCLREAIECSPRGGAESRARSPNYELG